MIIRGIFRKVSRFPLHLVLYLGNLDYFLDSLKGQSNDIFDPPSSFEPAWATDQRVKIVFCFVFFFAEIFVFFRSFGQYDTARSQVTHSMTSQVLRSIILRVVM